MSATTLNRQTSGFLRGLGMVAGYGGLSILGAALAVVALAALAAL